MNPAELTPPQLLSLAAAGYTAGLNPLGGGLHHLEYGGRPLIETYSGRPPKKAGVVLAPWPNRTAAGSFEWRGESYQLPITEPERNNASHGLVFDRIWQVSDCTQNAATMSIDIPAQQGWPWPIQLTAHYFLDNQGLHATFTARTEEQLVPFAFGLHTYLSAHGAPVDECELRVGVDKHYLLNERMVPTGAYEAARLSRQVADLELDDLFHRIPDSPVELIGPQGGTRMTLSENLTWLQIFTPYDFPGRGRAIATEPMSAPPNALATGIDLATLEPNKPWSATLTIATIPET